MASRGWRSRPTKRPRNFVGPQKVGSCMGYRVLSGRTEFCHFLDANESDPASLYGASVTQPHPIQGPVTPTHTQSQGPATALMGDCHPTVAPSGSTTGAERTPPHPPASSFSQLPLLEPGLPSLLRRQERDLSPGPRPSAARLHRPLTPSAAHLASSITFLCHLHAFLCQPVSWGS